MPKFELLKDAYQVLGGIPARQFKLAKIISERGGRDECGTIACGMGWLAIHPRFRKLMKVRLDPSSTFVYWRGMGNYKEAASNLFGVDWDVARNLFGPEGHSSYDKYCPSHKSKDLLLFRIKSYLRENGQLKEQLAAQK